MSRKIRTPSQGEVLLAVAAYACSAESLLNKIGRVEAAGNFEHPLSAQYDRILETKARVVQATQCS